MVEKLLREKLHCRVHRPMLPLSCRRPQGLTPTIGPRFPDYLAEVGGGIWRLRVGIADAYAFEPAAPEVRAVLTAAKLSPRV
jgi:hypothetical protein